MYFMGLTKVEKKRLETEVISNEARLKLTRLIRSRSDTSTSDTNVNLINRNRYINVARSVLGMPIYRLEPDDWGIYMNEEWGWHFAETELVMRRPDTAQLVETLADFLQQGMLNVSSVNGILAADNASVRFEVSGMDDNISIRFLSDSEIEEEADEPQHPNIRVLTVRMESAFEQKDYAGVLHASATIFETLAKLTFNNPSVENQTLAGMFEGYRKRSELPEPLLDYILETYKRRNVEPLAGHGATALPTIDLKTATVLIEVTKMCVRLERQLAKQEITTVQTSHPAQSPQKSGAGTAQPAKMQAAKKSPVAK